MYINLSWHRKVLVINGGAVWDLVSWVQLGVICIAVEWKRVTYVEKSSRPSADRWGSHLRVVEVLAMPRWPCIKVQIGKIQNGNQDSTLPVMPMPERMEGNGWLYQTHLLSKAKWEPGSRQLLSGHFECLYHTDGSFPWCSHSWRRLKEVPLLGIQWSASSLLFRTGMGEKRLGDRFPFESDWGGGGCFLEAGVTWAMWMENCWWTGKGWRELLSVGYCL